MSPGPIVLAAVIASATAMAFLYVIARGLAREERMIDLRFRIEKREREIETVLRSRKNS
jgi:hypothetical protein